ncbi:MAG: succinate dehydrogenase [Pseudomonadota bacterium]
MLDLRLYLAQRLSALVMAPLILGHIAVMIYAVQGGLTGAEILGRTAGSPGWFAFYGLLALATAVHAAIGLRVIAHEWLGLKGAALPALMWAAMAFLALAGLRAVWAVTYGVAA